MVLDTIFENWKGDKKSKSLISDQANIESTN